MRPGWLPSSPGQCQTVHAFFISFRARLNILSDHVSTSDPLGVRIPPTVDELRPELLRLLCK